MTALYLDITLLGAVDFTLNNYKRLANILSADFVFNLWISYNNIYLMLFILYKALIKLSVWAMFGILKLILYIELITNAQVFEFLM